MPVILLGHGDKGVEYKLIPGNRLRGADNNLKDKRRMMPDNVLGVNLHIEPKYVKAGRNCHRIRPDSSNSASSIKSAVSCTTLGTSLKSKGRQRPTTLILWADTDFVLVSDITSGKPSAMYLIYDFYPYITSLGKRVHIDNDYN